ncbi:MAG TPA: DUF420 domain-containing protein [Acidobacteriota bacterium]|nr:DUF420 domain-containing protein [Acidobacteriota bacterium]
MADVYLFLPHFNAFLNGSSAFLLLMGYYFIRTQRWRIHRAFMISATATSTVFLISYIVYHQHVGSVRFLKHGILRIVYFSVLTSHTILAVTILPMVIITLWRAVAEKFDLHKRVARWTLPIWLYVSITGVVVYVMLYRM